MTTLLNGRLALFTPWHIGTGQGLPGLTDAVLRTEVSGRPVVPATALKGLARDRAPLIEAATGVVLADRVFGRPPRRGAPPTNGRWAFGTARPTTDHLPRTRVSRHNRIDPDTGRVSDDLFFDAQVGEPVILGFTVEALVPVDALETAFVAACLSAVDRLGARRNRGFGACRISVVDDSGRDVTAETIEPLWSDR